MDVLSFLRNHRSNRRRELVDSLARYLITFGGVCVIIAITLIFAYLISVVYPLFDSAEIESKWTQSHANNQQTIPLYSRIDEYQETYTEVFADGRVQHFRVPTQNQAGKIIAQPPLEDVAAIQAVTLVGRAPLRYAWAEEDGYIRFVKHTDQLSYPDDTRLVTPLIEPLYGEDNQRIQVSELDITALAAREIDEEVLVAIQTSNQLELIRYAKESSLDGEGSTLEEDSRTILPTNQISEGQNFVADQLHLSNDGRWLIALSQEGLFVAYGLFEEALIENPQIIDTNRTILTSAWLLGEVSLLLGDNKGFVSKWFLNQGAWQEITSTQLSQKPISHIVSEHQRKVFAASDTEGKIGLFYAPSASLILTQQVSEQPLLINFTPRGDGLQIYSQQQQQWFAIDNEHPEINFRSLWSKIHYEGYPEPQHVWQSSAADQDFEAKLSLTPLTFGTLKAAFYAMLIAMPLAIFGAIYTAFFMSPAMRRMVKPTIETMEALPTVILGFLAGLWLSPFIENNLAAIFLTLWVMPVALVAFGWLWLRAPNHWIALINDQWRAALLVPVVIGITLFCFWLAQPIETVFFDGNLRQYISQELGISYDQRNAMVVGFAMGFAVIPTIFSISEDAVFSVPKHLVNGSLALGASSWQTLTGVVLPTASPGIFSGVMIGFGRAVGETMIVLMATGNTPIMDFNIFEGMRTLAANIAVEMPESEVGSSHYRVLFLAALVLFLFTFLFNTSAEIIRQRLRKKYGSL